MAARVSLHSKRPCDEEDAEVVKGAFLYSTFPSAEVALDELEEACLKRLEKIHKLRECMDAQQQPEGFSLFEKHDDSSFHVLRLIFFCRDMDVRWLEDVETNLFMLRTRAATPSALQRVLEESGLQFEIVQGEQRACAIDEEEEPDDGEDQEAPVKLLSEDAFATPMKRSRADILVQDTPPISLPRHSAPAPTTPTTQVQPHTRSPEFSPYVPCSDSPHAKLARPSRSPALLAELLRAPLPATPDPAPPFLSVPFEHALPWIAALDPRVTLAKGRALVDRSLWHEVLSTCFRQKFREGCQLLHARRKTVLLSLQEQLASLAARVAHRHLIWCKEHEMHAQLADHMPHQALTLDLALLDSEAPFLPPCVARIHRTLRTQHHIKHHDRMVYILFLKGTGVSVDDNITHLLTEFRQVMDEPTLRKKRYGYSIRHFYGLEGSRINRAPYSCTQVAEYSKCPFASTDKASVEQTLRSLPNATPASVTAVLECMPHRPQAACRHVFDLVHGYGDSAYDSCSCFPPSRDCTRCQPGRIVARAQFHSPNDYFAFSRVLRLNEQQEQQSENGGEADEAESQGGEEEQEEEF
eukprot:m.241957 g.241957  ORF g.241957 m.241957 type:complete len:582 (-) comp24955_c0_seq1:46-1791(-)